MPESTEKKLDISFKSNKTLKQFAPQAEDGTALDICIGGGRDALYLATIGYNVTVYDVLSEFSVRCNRIAEENSLNVKSYHKNLKEIDITPNSFDLITSAWILHSLKKSESGLLIDKMIKGLKPGGMIVISVFSENDPLFRKESVETKHIEENTFFSKEKNSYVHYFSKEELLDLFKHLKLISLVDKLNLDTGHGMPHYHGILEYVGKKEEVIPIYG